jgi:hypothetical protein
MKERKTPPRTPPPTKSAIRPPPGSPDEFVGTHVSPAEQVEIMLARKKAQGITDWALVWSYAYGRIRWNHDRMERHTWKATIIWSEPYFKKAYFDDKADEPLLLLIQFLAAHQEIE